MGYYDTAPGRLSILDLVALIASVVIFIIVISIVVIALSPLDFTGHIKSSVPLIVLVITVMISMFIIIIITVYIPEIITKG